MPELDLDELQRLCERATPAPWLNAGYDSKRGQEVVAGKHMWAVCQVYGVGPAFPNPEGGTMGDDAKFIAAARTAVPALIARVRELEADISHAVSEAMRRAPDYPWNLKTASECVWAIGESLLGVTAANGDLHTDNSRLAERVAELERTERAIKLSREFDSNKIPK